MELFNTLADAIILLAAAVAALNTICDIIGKPTKLFNKRRMTQEDIIRRLDELTKKVEDIQDHNKVQNEALKILLRYNILYIYNHHKDRKELTATERGQLLEAFKAYESLGGNNTIPDLVEQMKTWKVI